MFRHPRQRGTIMNVSDVGICMGLAAMSRHPRQRDNIINLSDDGICLGLVAMFRHPQQRDNIINLSDDGICLGSVAMFRHPRQRGNSIYLWDCGICLGLVAMFRHPRQDQHFEDQEVFEQNGACEYFTGCCLQHRMERGFSHEHVQKTLKSNWCTECLSDAVFLRFSLLSWSCVDERLLIDCSTERQRSKNIH